LSCQQGSTNRRLRPRYQRLTPNLLRQCHRRQRSTLQHPRHRHPMSNRLHQSRRRQKSSQLHQELNLRRSLSNPRHCSLARLLQMLEYQPRNQRLVCSCRLRPTSSCLSNLHHQILAAELQRLFLNRHWAPSDQFLELPGESNLEHRHLHHRLQRREPSHPIEAV